MGPNTLFFSVIKLYHHIISLMRVIVHLIFKFRKTRCKKYIVKYSY